MEHYMKNIYLVLNCIAGWIQKELKYQPNYEVFRASCS